MNGIVTTEQKSLRPRQTEAAAVEDEPPSKPKKKKKSKPRLRPWRDAARQQMEAATRQEMQGKHGDATASFNYRWEHVQAVVTLALKLADQTGADADIIEAAAWLHDICKWTHGEDHPAAGAAFAREFLPRTDFPPDKIEAVARAIAVHQGLWRDEPLQDLEAQVLWDADKLAKIGLTAVFHWTGGALAGTRSRTVAELVERGRSAEWQVRTVASMHTEPARRAAQARLDAYSWLWDTLESELAGEDLD